MERGRAREGVEPSPAAGPPSEGEALEADRLLEACRCQRGSVKVSSSGHSEGSAGWAAVVRREMASRGRRREGPEALGCDLDSGRGSGLGSGLVSCQGSRQSSSSSRIQSSLFSTQRPKPSSRARRPSPRAAERAPEREPGRAPDTPSTSCRPALTSRSKRCSTGSDQNSGMGPG